MKREAKWQTIWGNYVHELAKKSIFFYYELKQTTTNSFSYTKFEPHQIHSLLAMKNYGLRWKLSDADPRQKPCDGFSAPPLPAYVVIKFPECFCMIAIEKFLEHSDVMQKRSITLQEAKSIAYKLLTV